MPDYLPLCAFRQGLLPAPAAPAPGGRPRATSGCRPERSRRAPSSGCRPRMRLGHLGARSGAPTARSPRRSRSRSRPRATATTRRLGDAGASSPGRSTSPRHGTCPGCATSRSHPSPPARRCCSASGSKEGQTRAQAKRLLQKALRQLKARGTCGGLRYRRHWTAGRRDDGSTASSSPSTSSQPTASSRSWRTGSSS